jgi:hypothetical protein
MSEKKPEPEVIETAPMTAMATVDVRDASAQGLALMEERVKNQKKMLAIAVGLTTPNQWTVFAGVGKDGVHRESIYPTGGASDTILRRAFGLTWAEKEITVEDTPDGRLATCSAWLMRGDERLEHFTGYRMMGGYIKTEPDLRKGAAENMKSVAVRDLLGLRFRTPTELKEMGLDVNKLERRAEFQTHDQQGSAVVAPFGRSKGKPITDIDDGDLSWLTDTVAKSITDKDKAKWKAKNETLLAALKDERKRRDNPEKVEKTEKTEEAPGHDPKTGEVKLCAYPDCNAEATHGVFCGEHPPSKKNEAREPGSEG